MTYHTDPTLTLLADYRLLRKLRHHSCGARFALRRTIGALRLLRGVAA